MTTKHKPHYMNRFTRTTTSDYRHLLKEGETSFHQFYDRVECEFENWLGEFFCKHPHISPEQYSRELCKDPDNNYPKDVEDYIKKFYNLPDLHVEYTRFMRFQVDLPEPLAATLLQAVKSQGTSTEEFILEAVAKQIAVLDNVKDEPK